MPTGIVKWFNEQKRFGFITPDDGGRDLFVHANEVTEGSIRENDQVKYKVGQGKKGPCAQSVTVL